MITKEQLTELHAAAEAAHRPGVFWYQQDMLERFTRHFTGAELDATYIAAANPAMVLALMADNEAKAVRIAELEQERDHWKANHDNQVQRARILIERDDLPLERVREYERYAALEQDAARYRWLLKKAWFQQAFERYDFDDGGSQRKFEACADRIIDDGIAREVVKQANR